MKIKTITDILCLIIFILPQFSHGQISEELWVNYYDNNKQYDRFKSVKQTADSNFICIGSSFEDLWLVKVDKNGESIWSQSYKTNGSITHGYDVLEVDNEYYCIGTYDDDNQYGYAVLIVKYNSSGAFLWKKTIKYKNENILVSSSYVSKIINTSDNNIAVLAHNYFITDSLSNTDVWLLKLDMEGDTLWTKSYDLDSQYGKRPNSLIETTDSGYIITGELEGTLTTSFLHELFILKVDKNGNQLWKKLYGGTGWDDGQDIKQTSDGGFIIVGKLGKDYLNYEQNADLWLLKTDENGDTLWTRTYGGEKSEWGNSIEITSDNGYIITGMTETYGPGFWDVWVVRTDSLGDTLWTKAYGDSTIDIGYSISKTFDNGYIIGGYGGSYVSNTYDGYLIRLGPENPVSVEEEKENNLLNEYKLYQNYPNPFNPSTTISYFIPKSGFVQLKVYDVLGQVVSTLVNEHQISGKYSVRFGTNSTTNLGRGGLPSGVYFYKIDADSHGESENFNKVNKMLLLR